METEIKEVFTWIDRVNAIRDFLGWAGYLIFQGGGFLINAIFHRKKFKSMQNRIDNLEKRNQSQNITQTVQLSGVDSLPDVEFHMELEDQEVFYNKKTNTISSLCDQRRSSFGPMDARRSSIR